MLTVPNRKADLAPIAPGGGNALDGLISDFQAADIPEGSLREIHEIWLNRCDDERLPGRRDFDPIDLPRNLLPWITIFDFERDPARFRLRLVGTGIVEATGMDTTGRYLDDIEGAEQVQARAQWIVDHGKPFLVIDMPVQWAHERYSRYSTIGLPLATNGIDIDMIIYTMAFGH